jgi:hypothetical protein
MTPYSGSVTRPPFVAVRKFCRWTAEEDAKMLHLAKEGVPLKLMCFELNRTEEAIRARYAPGIRARREAEKARRLEFAK